MSISTFASPAFTVVVSVTTLDDAGGVDAAGGDWLSLVEVSSVEVPGGCGWLFEPPLYPGMPGVAPFQFI